MRLNSGRWKGPPLLRTFPEPCLPKGKGRVVPGSRDQQLKYQRTGDAGFSAPLPMREAPGPSPGCPALGILSMTIQGKTRRARQRVSSVATDEDKKKEAERLRQETARDVAFKADADHRVMTFRQWCALNGFSLATGRRILKSGTGPAIVRLSPRRIGVVVADNRAWLASRSGAGVALAAL
jgi:hypothetical protein